jgi:hypothetical protein
MRKPFGSISVRNDNGQAVLSWDMRSARECPSPADEFAFWRIYRQFHPDFDFGIDGPDYFLGLDGSAAELIHEGSLPAAGGHYTWRDTGAPLGAICSYYLASASSGLVGPLPVRLHDPEIIWPYRRLLPRLQTLAERAGSLAKLSVCGQSVAGRDIYSLELGTGNYCVAIVGLQHAGETGPELIVPLLERLLEHQPKLLQQARVLIVPALNVDRREELAEGVPWYLRTNLQGIDLNRNLPAEWQHISYSYGLDSSDPHADTYRGPAPLFAPETRALVAALEAAKPDVVLNYHWVYSLCALPGLTTPSVKEDTVHIARCWRLVRSWGEALFPNGEGLVADPTDVIPGLPLPGDWLRVDGTGGDLPTYLYATSHVPCLTFEGHLAEGTQRSQHGLVDRALLEEYIERHSRGLARLLEERI